MSKKDGLSSFLLSKHVFVSEDCIVCCVPACTCIRTHSHICALLGCAFRLCLRLPSSPGDECREIRDGLVAFGTLVFWGDSQPGAVYQADLVMTRKWRKLKVPMMS